MKFLKRLNKLFAVAASILMLVQPVLSVFPLLTPHVFAQDATPSSTIEETQTPDPTPTDEQPSPTPTEELSPTPTEAITPTPTEEVTPSVTPEETPSPTPTEEVSPTPAEESNQPQQSNDEPPKETGPPAENGQILDGASTEATPTPTITPEQPVEEGELQAIILENVEAESLDLDNVDPSNSATLTTDKADYAPTDTAVISGTDFTPGETYSLTISSSDPPPTSTTVEVTADENGSFVYAYQLDGIYRPNYKVEAKSNATIIAETTFTDAPVSGTLIDSDGANDEPGQKDLNLLFFDYTNPTSIDVGWNWDDAGFPGANTGDACALFDSDNDGYANFALCVTVDNDPATYQATSLYSCGDNRSDRCTSEVPISPFTSTCGASVQATDPFPGPGPSQGDEYPDDTEASCTAQLSEVGGSSSKLLDVCSFPSSISHSDPSDCIVASTAPQTGFLEIKKVLNPTSDTGKFNLQIDSTTYAYDVGHNGSTGEKVVDSGNHTFGETAGTGTSLSNYTTSVQCVDDNGAGSVVSTTGTNPWTVNVGNDDDIVCTITNTLNQGTLRIIKTVVNDNGGTLVASNFSFQVNSGTVTAFEGDGQNDLTVAPGTYSVTEPAVTGYATTYDNCTNVTVTSGGTTTCTITNNDVGPLLTVTKVVVNNSGGTKGVGDFPLFVDATSVTSEVQNSFNPGTYTVSETQSSGYAAAISGDCAANGSITLALGDAKSCTITNDDIAPTLTLIKTVINDNGGNNVVSDFVLKIDGVTVTSGVPETLAAGAHTANEITLTGYTPSTWGGDCATDGAITLNPGDAKTCTITNDDVAPTITLRKAVTNDNGGTAGVDDFGLTVGGNPVGSGQQVLVNANTPIALNEAGLTGYSFISLTGDNKCPTVLGGAVTLTEGENVSCTITNDDNAPSLTLVKEVTNNNGGTALPSAWTLTATGPSGFSGSGPSVSNEASFDAGTYGLSESGPDGYTASDWVCVGGSQTDGDTIQVANAQEVTCTITNDDEAPTITLIKEVTNDDGGDAGVDDFGLMIGDTVVNSGDTLNVDANTPIALNEAGLTGYEFFSLTGDNLCPEVLGGTVTLSEGQDITCTITNDDQAPTLTLVKKVVNDSGEADDPSQWTLTADGTGGFSEPGPSVGPYDVLAGEDYTLTESDGISGYTASFWDCDGGNLEDNILTLGLDEDVTCTITNTRDLGNLIVHKYLDEDGNGTFETLDPDTFNWGLANDNTPNAMGAELIDLETGPYSVYESEVPDNHFVGWYVTSDTQYSCANIPEGNNTLPAGIEVLKDTTTNITLCNARDTGTITVDKVTHPSEANQEFTIRLSDEETDLYDYLLQDTTTAETKEFMTGTYSLDELDDVLGWDLTNASCAINDGDPEQYTEGDLLELGYGDNITCTFENTQRGTVIVTKYNDENDNGTQDEGEDVLSGWTMNLDSEGTDEEDTDEFGKAIFENMLPGTYTLSEELQDGWEQTQLSCDGEESDSFVLDPGEEQHCVVGNHQLNPILTVSKTNNAGGDKNPGDSVTFTITVTATQSAAFNVEVTDLPAGGFTYRAGSWTSSSTLRGDLKLSGVTTEPTYASPGVWKLGDMPVNDVVTLTYIADISSDQKPGIYKDNAWAYGCRFETDCVAGGANSVLSNAMNPGYQDENFVGTEVAIVKDQQSGATLNPTTGEVLGAATELPATGADELWLKLAALLFLLGIGLVAAGKYARRFYV